MGVGRLIIQLMTGGDAIPLANARVMLEHSSGEVFYETNSDANGNTEYISLTAPDIVFTLDPGFRSPAYSVCDVTVIAEGFVTEHIHGVQIVDTQRTILPVHMLPLTAEPHHMTDHHIDISAPGLLLSSEYLKEGLQESSGLGSVLIPDFITVHLGSPSDTSVGNVRVAFLEYIKNVASGEIYSTWPHNALVANIHAIVTFALNRVFTEWYRSRGYPFDITNSTQYDQSYQDGGIIFENINQIVDEIFNIYARRIGFANPFFTQFCNGTTTTCPGLSQWGTVELANQGMAPLEILRYYYSRDLELVPGTNTSGITESFPGYALSLGYAGEPVRQMQNHLNRIRVNYPLIPVIPNPNGNFGIDTQNAVQTFQQTFHLTADGIIDRETWNRISSIFVSITRLAELDSEGIRVTIGESPPNAVLSWGARGEHVLELQAILNVIAMFYNTVPSVIQDSVFGSNTETGVLAFQTTFGLTPNGIVDAETWNKLYSVYRGIKMNVHVPPVVIAPQIIVPPYPGTILRFGSTGPNVRLMQSYLTTIGTVYPNIPHVQDDGIFGNVTESAVIAFQQEFLLAPDGTIGLITWNKIVEQYLLVTGNIRV